MKGLKNLIKINRLLNRCWIILFGIFLMLYSIYLDGELEFKISCIILGFGISYCFWGYKE